MKGTQIRELEGFGWRELRELRRVVASLRALGLSDDEIGGLAKNVRLVPRLAEAVVLLSREIGQIEASLPKGQNESFLDLQKAMDELKEAVEGKDGLGLVIDGRKL